MGREGRTWVSHSPPGRGEVSELVYHRVVVLGVFGFINGLMPPMCGSEKDVLWALSFFLFVQIRNSGKTISET
ncbi:hypothetical protein RRG08_001428 [Elysia crispata]|uniref:Uncharacterized protein n=1 Tax=Elysia crispata TaxID=231223 RepID=A0AAE1DK53_9GAST|nr:hypothetical protein RRG08_001428 [Elysia crispata]